MAARKKEALSREPEVKTTSYLPAGVKPEVERGPVTLDPELAKIRDEEIEKLAKVPSRAPLGVPTIDPELVKQRDAEIARDAKRAGAPAEVAASVDESPAPAKKAASSKSKKS